MLNTQKCQLLYNKKTNVIHQDHRRAAALHAAAAGAALRHLPRRVVVGGVGVGVVRHDVGGAGRLGGAVLLPLVHRRRPAGHHGRRHPLQGLSFSLSLSLSFYFFSCSWFIFHRTAMMRGIPLDAVRFFFFSFFAGKESSKPKKNFFFWLSLTRGNNDLFCSH